MVRTLASGESELASHVLDRTHALADEIVEVATTPFPWAQGECLGWSELTPACLLEACALAAALHAADSKPVSEVLLEHLRSLLLTSDKGKGKERASIHSSHSSPSRSDKRESPRPDSNTRVLALRCLANLPPVWQDGLTEAHMAALMAGVDSADSTVRREVGPGRCGS